MDLPIYVTRPYLPPKEEFDRLTDEIWHNRWLTNNGTMLCRFEAALEDYLRIPGLSLTTNGHLALDTVLKAMELTGEVVTTPFTFASTTHAITQNGLTPVFCDIEEQTLTLDATKLEQCITERTSAILAVHVYGHPCDVEKIGTIAKKYGLKVIYDAAHAFGVRLGGKSIIEYGDASIFSFHATKLFHSIEGGMAYAADPALLRRFDLIRNYGIENEELVSAVGGNAKMNEFQAAMGLLVLRRMDDLISLRKAITAHYIECLSGMDGIKPCCVEPQETLEYNYGYFPIRVLPDFPMNRDALYEGLKTKGIYTRKYFYPLTSDFACYREKYSSDDTPIAKMIAGQILALPIYDDLSLDEVDNICKSIREIALSRR